MCARVRHGVATRPNNTKPVAASERVSVIPLAVAPLVEEVPVNHNAVEIMFAAAAARTRELGCSSKISVMPAR